MATSRREYPGSRLAIATVLAGAVAACVWFLLVDSSEETTQEDPSRTSSPSAAAQPKSDDLRGSGSLMPPNRESGLSEPANGGIASAAEAFAGQKLADWDVALAEKFTPPWGWPDIHFHDMPEEKIVLIAAFPEVALSHYRRVLRTDDSAWSDKLAAIWSLGVLARGQHPEVRSVYLDVVRTDKNPDVLEWSTRFLGRYYHGTDVRDVMYSRALQGSACALEGLAYYADVSLDAIASRDVFREEELEQAREKVAVLRDAEARRMLREILQGERSLKHSKYHETMEWAIGCAARLEYVELADVIRAALPSIGSKIFPGGTDDWTFWKKKSDDRVYGSRFAHAVQAVGRLSEPTPLERQCLAYNFLLWDKESVLSGIRLRGKTGEYADIVEGLEGETVPRSEGSGDH